MSGKAVSHLVELAAEAQAGLQRRPQRLPRLLVPLHFARGCLLLLVLHLLPTLLSLLLVCLGSSASRCALPAAAICGFGRR